MQLTEKYAPAFIEDIVGQHVGPIANWLKKPDSRCWLFVGPPGTGKTSAAWCIARWLGCADPCSGLFLAECGNLPKQDLVDFITYAQRYKTSLCGKWYCLLLEEFELMHPSTQIYLKTALDVYNRPERLVVVATSNTTEKINEALLERFEVIPFRADAQFAKAALHRLQQIYHEETGNGKLPASAPRWGWQGNRFSMRRAIQRLERYIQEKGQIDIKF